MDTSHSLITASHYSFSPFLLDLRLPNRLGNRVVSILQHQGCATIEALCCSGHSAQVPLFGYFLMMLLHIKAPGELGQQLEHLMKVLTFPDVF